MQRTPPLMLLLLLCSIIATSALANSQATTVEWIDLLPEEDLRLLESIPQVDHEALSDDELAQDTAPSGLKPAQNSSAFEDEVANAVGVARQQAGDQGLPEDTRKAQPVKARTTEASSMVVTSHSSATVEISPMHKLNAHGVSETIRHGDAL